MQALEMVQRGFRRLTGGSEPRARVPAQDGRLFVVTGASAGIGAETALGLARAGATVVVVGRNPERTAGVAERIRTACGASAASHELADFGSLAAVGALADRLLEAHPRIDGLINNAGVWHPRFQRSEEGFEHTFAVNHLAPFLLTLRLQERLVASAARVVTVSSRLHEDAPAVVLDDPDWVRRGYGGLAAYAESKLANLLFTRGLARRLEGSAVTAVSVHPGDVSTEVTRDVWALRQLQRLVAPLLLTPEEGAQTTLHAATVPEAEPGAYYAACAVGQPAPQALDDAAADALWEASVRMVQPWLSKRLDQEWSDTGVRGRW